MAALVAGLAWPAAHAQSPSNPYNYARTSSFTYDATTGLLSSETVEPANPQSCVVTSYTVDRYGNRLSSMTTHCSGAAGRAPFPSRTASNSFVGAASQTITVAGAAVAVAVPAGQFADQATNALGQTARSTTDPRFGTALTVTDPNGLSTTWSLDDLGRKTVERRADGTSTVTAYCYLAAGGLDTSSNSASCVNLIITPGEVPADAIRFVHTEPHNTAGARNGPFVRVYLDRAGRTLRTVTEAFDGATQGGGANRLIAQDTDYNATGVPLIETQPYFLDSGSSTSGGSGDYGMSSRGVDRLGRTVVTYVADGAGNSPGINFGGRGTRRASRTIIGYAGLTTTTTNDQGQSKVEEKNVIGEVVRTTDALGAQLARQFDAFGNLVATRDALGNGVTLAYDLRGRKTAMTDPDTGSWRYDYDALGQLVWQQSPNELAAATATTMVYDVLGRRVQRVDPEYTSTWIYDTYAGGVACSQGIGKLCQSATTNGLSRKFTYDALGRPQDVRTDVAGGPSLAGTALYDNVNGRVSGQIYPTGLKVTYGYTPKGFLQGVQTATALVIAPKPKTAGGATRSAGVTLPANTVLWSALSQNAWGRLERRRDNLQADGVTALTTTVAYDPLTGRVRTEQAGLGAATAAMNLDDTWDDLGRVVQRTDHNGANWVDNAGVSQTGAVGDTLTYDATGRLQTDTVAAPAIPGLSRTVSFDYNALGMLLSKSDVGVYTYPAAGAARPHAVQSVSGAYGASYGYDANGNAKTASAGPWRNVTYTSFNLPDGQVGLQGPTVGTSGSRYLWLYDENHARFKEVRVNGTGTRTTWMLHPDNAGGLGFERETQASATSNRHYLSAGGLPIGVIVTGDALPTLAAGATAAPALATVNASKLEYWHLDRQGSLMATTDHAGAITQVYAYDPFGKRRNRNGNYDASGALVFDWTTATDSGTDRGYTGHEHLDDVGLIHMNGRLYDPTIGRFLQGDPFIANPANLADYDRFAYCMNNPVTCTDPSGYLHLFGHNILPGIFHNQTLMTVAAIGAAALLSPASSYAIFANSGGVFGAWGAVANTAVAGFVSGAISTGNVKGALEGSVTAMAFYGVGSAVGAAAQASLAGAAESVALHGVVGCASSAMSGGKCGSGALSAAFADAVTLMPGMQGINKAAIGGSRTAFFEGTFIASVAGGTASVLGGGKFVNGAITGAAGYLFNELQHYQGTAQERYAMAGYNGFALDSVGMDAIQKYEGFSLNVYSDSAGLPTVGWGHLVTPFDRLNLGDAITQQQAQYFFDRDTAGAVGAVNRLIPFGSTQSEFNAAVSLTFNIGANAFSKSQVLQNWAVGNFDAMNSNWEGWNLSGGRVVNGLTQRRLSELWMFYTGN